MTWKRKKRRRRKKKEGCAFKWVFSPPSPIHRPTDRPTDRTRLYDCRLLGELCWSLLLSSSERILPTHAFRICLRHFLVRPKNFRLPLVKKEKTFITPRGEHVLCWQIYRQSVWLFLFSRWLWETFPIFVEQRQFRMMYSMFIETFRLFFDRRRVFVWFKYKTIYFGQTGNKWHNQSEFNRLGNAVVTVKYLYQMLTLRFLLLLLIRFFLYIDIY